MSLKSLISSIERKEVLLPKLRRFLLEEQERLDGKLFKHKDIVIQDALMTAKTFLERIKEYNHGGFTGDFFHPSQLGGCIRAAWFDVMKAPKNCVRSDSDDLLRTHLVFETGTYVGVVFQNLCERAKLLTRREIPIVDRVNKILGHADGEVRIEEVFYTLEIKTINSRQFAELKKLGKPKNAHKRQLIAYMHSLGRQWGVIVYLEKDRHQTLEFVVQYDPQYWQTYVNERIRKFFRQVKQGVLPEREGLSPISAPCSWCAYSHICYDTMHLKKWLTKHESAT
jgi:hypothetical protein